MLSTKIKTLGDGSSEVVDRQQGQLTDRDANSQESPQPNVQKQLNAKAETQESKAGSMPLTGMTSQLGQDRNVKSGAAAEMTSSAGGVTQILEKHAALVAPDMNLDLNIGGAIIAEDPATDNNLLLSGGSEEKLPQHLLTGSSKAKLSPERSIVHIEEHDTH